MTSKNQGTQDRPPLALVTGVSRVAGIGLALTERLAADGFEIAASGWPDYDQRMAWGADSEPPPVTGLYYRSDFTDPGAPAALIAEVNRRQGPIRVLILGHCESVDSDLFSTTIESFDRHMAVNARATWQLIKAFAQQFEDAPTTGRIVALTSDHVVGNLPYGASKAALDRVVLASAVELSDRGITANVINPGAVDTGWMTPEIEHGVRAQNLQPRVGTTADAANLVSFLCSPEGQWVNGQLLYSTGGLRPGG